MAPLKRGAGPPQNVQLQLCARLKELSMWKVRIPLRTQGYCRKNRKYRGRGESMSLSYSKRHNKFLLPVPAKAIYGSFCRTENEIFNVVNYSIQLATCKQPSRNITLSTHPSLILYIFTRLFFINAIGFHDFCLDFIISKSEFF